MKHFPLRSLGLKSKAREGVGDDMWQDLFSLTQTKRLNQGGKRDTNRNKTVKQKQRTESTQVIRV